MNTKNLGLVQAISVGLNPPNNTMMLWFDNNTGIQILKYYDLGVNQWVPLNYGISGDLTQVIPFTSQTTVVTTYTIPKKPSVTIIDSTGEEIEGEVNFNYGTSTLTVSFNSSESGFIILN